MSKLLVVQARHVVLPAVAALIAVALAVAGAGSTREATAALPAGNTVEQWNKIAEDTVVGSGAFQSEGLLYMAYESTAVYDAVVSLEGGYQPLEPAFRVSKQASPDAAVVEAAYRILRHYFPASYASLDASLRGGAGGDSKRTGQGVGTADRSRRRQPGDPGAERRRPDDADRDHLELPDPSTRTGRVAADAALSVAADAVGRQCPPVHPPEPIPVPAAPAAGALQPGVGRRVQRGRGLRRREQHGPNARSDEYRAVLVGERDPTIQRGRAGHRRRARSQPR